MDVTMSTLNLGLLIGTSKCTKYLQPIKNWCQKLNMLKPFKMLKNYIFLVLISLVCSIMNTTFGYNE